MIEGVLSAYSIGDYVTANCTSGKSSPTAVLAWQINGAQVSIVDLSAFLPQAIVSQHKYSYRGLVKFSYILNRKNNGTGDKGCLGFRHNNRLP